MSNRRCFTLIELLVVVAIVAVLVAILLPALGKARDQARTVGCLSNENQVYKGVLYYSEDNSGWIPYTAADWWATTGPKPYWINTPANNVSSKYAADALQRYVGNDREIFHCPADEYFGKGIVAWERTSYWYNYYLPAYYYETALSPSKLDKLQLVLDFEERGRVMLFGCLPFKDTLPMRHGTQDTWSWGIGWYTTILFLDGHARFLAEAYVEWPWRFYE